ncbi:hypothetical protein P7K49_013566 [Saguinus oedipus]|uniref:Uncharacterized protein n=1 Tax=Saguinus oedipus TaxID=9490 RepID=A0ABQ9VGA3_SAGOE|nr:hypothetical protein P7K49_013566 [Saguinus oedipus]
MRTRAPGLSGRPPSSQRPMVSASDTVHWNVAPSPSRALTDRSSESTSTARSGADPGRERGGAEGRCWPRPHAPFLGARAVRRVAGRLLRRSRAQSSAQSPHHPIPTVHGQADRPGAGRPHRAAVGPGVRGAAAPQLEKAARAQGLEPEPRAWSERAPVLGAGVAEGRGGHGWARPAAPSVDAKGSRGDFMCISCSQAGIGLSHAFGAVPGASLRRCHPLGT